MIARLIAITAWLAAGHAVVFGLLWLLLQVPESNAWMLLVSALLVVAIVACASFVEGVGVSAWTPGTSWRQGPARSARALPAAILAVVLFGGLYLATALAYAAWVGHRGEIDAWLMLHFGWTRTARLHSAVWWVVDVVRWVVGVSLALSVIGWAVSRGLASLGRAGWLAAAFSPRRLLALGLLLFGLIYLPWKAAYWRPAWVQPNWQEPAFVAVKLSLLYLLACLAWAGVLKVVETGCRTRGATAAAATDGGDSQPGFDAG